MSLAMIGLGGGELILLLFFIPLVLLSTVFQIFMLVSAIQNKGIDGTEKICWVLAIIFLHCVGGLAYLFIAHPKRNNALSS